MADSQLQKNLHGYAKLAEKYELGVFTAVGYLVVPTLYFNGDKPADHIEDEDFLEKMTNKLGVSW
jgi:hypothetical protein